MCLHYNLTPLLLDYIRFPRDINMEKSTTNFESVKANRYKQKNNSKKLKTNKQKHQYAMSTTRFKSGNKEKKEHLKEKLQFRGVIEEVEKRKH